MQQAARLLVDPVLQRLVRLRRAHPALIGRGVVRLSQNVQRLLHEADVLIQPQRGGEDAGRRAVVAVVLVPERAGLLAQSRNAVRAQQGEDLRAALAVRQLGEHGQRHVDVQRGEHAVFPAALAEEFPQGGGQKAVEAAQIPDLDRAPVTRGLRPGVHLGRVPVLPVRVARRLRIDGRGQRRRLLRAALTAVIRRGRIRGRIHAAAGRQRQRDGEREQKSKDPFHGGYSFR